VISLFSVLHPDYPRAQGLLNALSGVPGVFLWKGGQRRTMSSWMRSKSSCSTAV
jgi:hypothetical protein